MGNAMGQLFTYFWSKNSLVQFGKFYCHCVVLDRYGCYDITSCFAQGYLSIQSNWGSGILFYLEEIRLFTHLIFIAIITCIYSIYRKMFKKILDGNWFMVMSSVLRLTSCYCLFYWEAVHSYSLWLLLHLVSIILSIDQIWIKICKLIVNYYYYYSFCRSWFPFTFKSRFPSYSHDYILHALWFRSWICFCSCIQNV